ncbi:hypothetical protein JY651_42495 [Pyxidicoccus parkwayensis]|uniref:Uncharacterized protein n=1 Tax=Pyxidicoccus parkwayensis TaxID=2813578 RepID=A0ABX7NSK0_9BACT|nr:hypothetical protein [Pyxidicoccus parkwaysis]QSQ21755.1 hypothetical protein JY651_42495 [Pyxidicoccus parkwaysis]
MRLSLVGGWLLSVALAGMGGYGLARSNDSGAAPRQDSDVLEQLKTQQALLVSLRAQVSALDSRLGDASRAPVMGVTQPLPTPMAAVTSEPPEEDDAEVEAREHARVEAEALVSRGERVVEAALVTGHWRQEDMLSLRALLPTMPKTQRDALLSRLITAYNEGRLTQDEQGPLF